ncbi:MAG: hypothetical protein DMF65_14185, partial [Acidobacteria bacterium]
MQQRTPTGWRASVSTLAGSGAPGYADGAARAARFADPFGIAIGREGSLYVADAGESNRIRKITPRGEVSTLAGGREGYADGAGAAAAFDTPSALALDRDGNLYVADTANNRIRRVTPDGSVTTVAGDGTAGFRDGPASQAQFDSPVGVAVDEDGSVYVADTYNDRVRVLTKDGKVKTIAGMGRPGYSDGDAGTALFDTPCAVVAGGAGEVFVADTGNNRLRKITKNGQVSTLNLVAPTNVTPNSAAPNDNATPDANAVASDDANLTTNDNTNLIMDGNANSAANSATTFELSKPAGLAATRDGFLYVTELDRARVVHQPAAIALASDGSLVVADAANYLIRHVSPTEQHEGKATTANAEPDASRDARDGNQNAQVESLDAGGANQAAPPSAVESSSTREVLPRIPTETFGDTFPWPLDPQTKWHEVSATMGEVRGAYDSSDSRDHLHAGLDVFGVYGQTVRAVREEKISSPLPNWGFGTLNEGLRAGLITYVHLRVGRDEHDRVLNSALFIAVRGDDGALARVRLRRGTRLRVGDALGTINRMYHVHMNLGPPGAEANPLTLPLAGFTDHTAPKIERDGVQLFGEAGERLTEKRGGRLTLRGSVRIDVDAYDQVDGNQPRRRLGLYRLGYQLLLPDGSHAPGFDRPRITIEFNRLPPDPDASKIAYADTSGITVYG